MVRREGGRATVRAVALAATFTLTAGCAGDSGESTTGETETETLAAIARGVAHLEELLEYLVLGVRFDADTGVGDGKRH